MLRSRFRIPRISVAAPMVRQQRSLHDIPQLHHNFSRGVPGFLSQEAFDMAWNEYMTLMIDKLNALTAGSDLEQRDLKYIAQATARDPDRAPIFNHASMAHNTHFFFKNLTPSPKRMPEALAEDLARSFSSVETLQREMILTACAMFGPGFVWLMKKPLTRQYAILTTYLAGSPYPGAYWRAQTTDMNVHGIGRTAEKAFRDSARAQRIEKAPGGLDAVPLLCLCTWEHTWLRDYGLGVGGIGGKRGFAEAWWKVINWEAVFVAADIQNRPPLVQ